MAPLVNIKGEPLFVKTEFRLEHQASLVKGRWHGFAVTEGFNIGTLRTVFPTNR